MSSPSTRPELIERYDLAAHFAGHAFDQLTAVEVLMRDASGVDSKSIRGALAATRHVRRMLAATTRDLKESA